MPRRRRAPPWKSAVGERPKITGSVVKSAGRVLQVLEFFDDIRRESNVVEIKDALGYPQSSTSALLRSLVELGYLNYNNTSRTYIPTTRVALLGTWIDNDLMRDGGLLETM